jgi:hypothetical protein
MAVGAQALAQFNESEPNDNKSSANVFSGLVTGSTINGTSTGNPDVFRISTAAAAPGIYQHRIRLFTTVPGPSGGHVGRLLGLMQVNHTIGGDTPGQTSGVSSLRYNQWYGFGKAEQIYYQITGDSFTTAPCVATLETTPVTPVFLGQFQAGQITIDTVGRNPATNPDTEIWVYDANFNAIPGYGNDYSGAGAPWSNNARLTRTYAPGTYYLALSNYNLANNLPLPADDPNGIGPGLDFPNAIMNSNTSPAELDFGIVDSRGTREFQADKPGPYGVYWARFDVVPEPGTVLGLSAALSALALRLRRRRS